MVQWLPNLLLRRHRTYVSSETGGGLLVYFGGNLLNGRQRSLLLQRFLRTRECVLCCYLRSFSTRSRMTRLASWGFALPCEAFMIWPTKKPNFLSSPRTRSAYAPACSATTWSTMATIALSSLICGPSDSAIFFGSSPVSNIRSKRDF